MRETAVSEVSAGLSAVAGSTSYAGALEITDAAGVQRVTLGALGGGDYGLKVVSAGGLLVIIDGNSDMFRILASGTTSLTLAADTSGSNDVNLSGLGSFATTPAHLSFISTDSGSGSARDMGMTFGLWAKRWAAATSGGAVTSSFIALNAGGTQPGMGKIYTLLSGSTCLLRTDGLAINGTTFYGRYYVLAQTAI